MITVHPEFDPSTQTWFVPDLEYEAPTLRALLAQMGGQVRIRDYYPGGLGAAIVVRHMENGARIFKAAALDERQLTRALESPTARPRPQTKAPKARGKSGGNHKHDHDRVMDLWAEGVYTGRMVPRGEAS